MTPAERYAEFKDAEYNGVTVVDPFLHKNKHGFPVSLCRCVCGREFEAVLYDVKSGHTKSCGCLAIAARRESGRKRKKHGACGHRLFATWNGMMIRCYDQTSVPYQDYGGRGIKVCERWQDPWKFFEDMGERPFADASIDRIDNDGDYCPKNTRWADRKTQMRNKRSNRLIECFGRTQCLSMWAEETGIDEGTIRDRLDNLDWPVEKALTQPKRKVRKQTQLCAKGEAI